MFKLNVKTEIESLVHDKCDISILEHKKEISKVFHDS